GFFVEHAYVHQDLAGLIVGSALKFDSHPAVTLSRAAIASRDHGIGESEERSVIAAFGPQPLDVELKFVVEHRLEPTARNVAVSVAVDGVAHFHVVSRHALGDCSRGAADPEKPADYFLSRTDLGKGTVPARIEINPERLGMGIDRFLFHGVRNKTLLSM